jgi:hypothetical protein
VKDQLIFDMERLLSNRDELRGIRQTMNIQNYPKSQYLEMDQNPNSPKPVIFTKPSL